MGRAISDFIIGIIGKQRTLRIHSASGQTTQGRDKHPVIGVTYHTDKEITHAVIVGNLIESLAIYFNIYALDIGVILLLLLIADVYSLSLHVNLALQVFAVLGQAKAEDTNFIAGYS